MKRKKRHKDRWTGLCAVLLAVCLLLGDIPQNVLAAEENAASAGGNIIYEIYLADFLSQDPRLGSDLSLEMLHRRLNTAIDEEYGFRESAEAYLFLTDGGSLVFEDKQELYKQVLLEILCKQAASEDTLEKTRESSALWRDTILEYAAMALDYGPEILSSDSTLRQMLTSSDPSKIQNAFLASTVYGVVQQQGKAGSLEEILTELGLGGSADKEMLKTCLSKIDDAAYASGRTLKRAVENTAEGFRLSGNGGGAAAASGAGSMFSSETASGIGVCVNMLLSATQNMLDYTEKMSMYMALSEYREGTLEFLDLMYRQTNDPSLMAALRSVSAGIQSVSSRDVARLAADLEFGTSLKIVSDILMNLVQQWCGAAGLIVGGATILTELMFQSGEIAELSRLLEAQIAVEDAVRGGLRYMINTYGGQYQQAVTLNAGAYMLYDTYEYGMELAVSYAETVMDDAWISKIGNKLLEFFNRGVYGSRYVPREGSYSFKELAKAYEALITTGRSVFDSARQMYEEEHPGPSVSETVWDEPPILVTGIVMEQEPLLLSLSGDDTSAYFASAFVVPSNADNRRILYKSSDPAVAEVDEFGQLTPIAPGSAWITASTEEGNFAARRQVIVVLGQEAKEPLAQLRLENVSKDCYKENEDGVTLLQPVGVDLKGSEYLKEYLGTPYYANGQPIPGPIGEITDIYSNAGLVIPAYVNGQPVTELDFRERREKLKKESGGKDLFGELGRLSVDQEKDIIFAVEIPDTVKRIADGCFENCSFMGGIRLGGNLESVGERAFAGADFYGAYAKTALEESGEDSGEYQLYSGETYPIPDVTDTIILPESIKVLGESAFEGADFEGSRMVIEADVEAIPDRYLAEAKNLGEIAFLSPDLKRIGDEAFSSIAMDAYVLEEIESVSEQLLVQIPDTVETIGHQAFANDTRGYTGRASETRTVAVQALPASLKELGSRAFVDCDLEEGTFPAGLKEIPENAFVGAKFGQGSGNLELPAGLDVIGARAFMHAEMSQILLPDSLERMGESAFEGCTARRVTCFDTEGEIPKKGKIEYRAFANCPSLEILELPAGATQVGEDLFRGSEALKELVWPAGLGGIEKQTLSGEGGLYITMRGKADGTKEVELPDMAFTCVPGRSIPYMELPASFAGRLNLGAFDQLTEKYWDPFQEVSAESRFIGTLFIQGVVEEVLPGEEAQGFEDFVRDAVYALDENGSRICLYRRQPDSYTKISKFCQEDSEAYQIDFPAETQLLTEQTFGDYSANSLRLNGDGETAKALEAADITVYNWYNEEESVRALELGEFLEFEDIYLRQPQYRYYRVGVNTEGVEQFSFPGKYQIIFELPPEWDGEATAAYHIDESGLITRLAGDFYNDGTRKEFRALSDDIGSFAVAAMTHLSQEIQGDFLEERHKMFWEAYRQAGEDPLEFPLQGGIVTIVRPKNDGSESGNAEGTVTVSYPGQGQEKTDEGTVSQTKGSEDGSPQGDAAQTDASEDAGSGEEAEENLGFKIQSTGSNIRLEIGLTDLTGRIPILSKTAQTEAGQDEDGGLLSFLSSEKKVSEITIEKISEADGEEGGTVWYEAVLEEPGEYQLRLEEERAGWKQFFQDKPFLMKAGIVVVVLWLLKKAFGRKRKKAAARKNLRRK